MRNITTPNQSTLETHLATDYNGKKKNKEKRNVQNQPMKRKFGYYIK